MEVIGDLGDACLWSDGTQAPLLDKRQKWTIGNLLRRFAEEEQRNTTDAGGSHGTFIFISSTNDMNFFQGTAPLPSSVNAIGERFNSYSRDGACDPVWPIGASYSIAIVIG